MIWQSKAHKIIEQLSRESYEAANRLPNGQWRKRHRPYAIPEAARELIKCLDANDEHRAKSLMMWDYDTEQAYERTKV
jgi:hypothetical protein